MSSRKGLFIWYDDAEQFKLLTDEQLGKLIRGLLSYSESREPQKFDDPALQMAFSFMAARDDRDLKAYEEKLEKRREAGKKGGRPKKANGFSENRTVSEENKEQQKKPSSTSTSTSTLISTSTIADNESGAAAPTPTDSPAQQQYGKYGWVKLSQGEYAQLLNELGEAELKRCITYLDESAQSNGNKNKWKDWELVIRRCSRDRWGIRELLQQNVLGVLQQLHSKYEYEDESWP